MDFREMLKRLRNTGVIISLASLVILILVTNGIHVDNERVMTTVKALCSIGVILGALNVPTTGGVDLPFVTSEKSEEKEVTKDPVVAEKVQEEPIKKNVVTNPQVLQSSNKE